MAIVSGQQFGTYSIGDSIGVGGMGKVFRGTDTKLKRDVAIKVLPDSFSTDEDRLARFQREAEILAALNHPNIAQIYGIEESGETTAIIMELVEGPTLAERIAEGPLPPDEAMSIAEQVIAALEAAHEQHIVHRDLKPANIKLREDGTVKVLDFGIAKALEAHAISGGRSLAPSLTTPALTESGLIMGTAAYMSPEQARGKRVDQRADVWAFACVLYEMLTGQPAFGGDDVTVTLARVIERDTDLDSIPGALSPAVRHTLKLCLMKDPKRRVADIRDVRLALAGEFESLDAGAEKGRGRSVWQIALPVGLAAAVIAGVLVWLIALPGRQAAQPGSDVVRYDLPVVKVEGDTASALYLGANDAVQSGGWPFYNALAFSHDGSMLAYSAWESDENRELETEIVLNRLNQNRPAPVAGTARARSPFFSPDDQWLGFEQDLSLKRVSLASGNIETILSDAEIVRFGIFGAHWLDDGTIVFATYNGIFRIRENGSALEKLSPDIEVDFELGAMPRVLPGGNTVLFHTVNSGRRPADGKVRALDVESGTQTVILADAQQPWYLPQIGQLLFMRQGTLMAIAFDPLTLTTQGEPLVVVENVVQAYRNGAILLNSGIAQFDISAAGHLAYAPGGVFPKADKQSIRITPEGDVEFLITGSFNFLTQRLSPDGTRIVFGDMYGHETGLYVYGFDRGFPQRLNTGPGFNITPLWSPDGETILYTSDQDGLGEKMYVVPADGSTEPEPLLPSDLYQNGASWSSQGVIAFLGRRPDSNDGSDIWVMEPDKEPTPFVVAEGSQAFATFSPDGKWLLYSSDEGGIPQIFVRPYPEANPETRISPTGGVQPAWSKDGGTIFYRAQIPEEGRAPHVALMRVDFRPGTPGNPPVVGRPEPYIDPFPFDETNPIRHYDVMEDGSIITAATEEQLDALRTGSEPRMPAEVNGIREIKVVHNFVDELRQRLAQ